MLQQFKMNVKVQDKFKMNKYHLEPLQSQCHQRVTSYRFKMVQDEVYSLVIRVHLDVIFYETSYLPKIKSI